MLEIWPEAGGLLRIWAPSAAEDEQAREEFGRYLRAGSSPSAAVALLRMNVAADIRSVIAGDQRADPGDPPHRAT